MTTTNTQDVSATVAQSITLAEAGCEIIRITAPKKAAQALKDIHRKFRNAGFNNPLVADIHFLPSAAMEAVEHVEKVLSIPAITRITKSSPFANIQIVNTKMSLNACMKNSRL